MPSDRTLFYSLPLAGGGTSEVESLRSYVQRLAFAHHLRPRTLLERLVERHPFAATKVHPKHIPANWEIHGACAVGSELVERLSAATLQELQISTMGRFGGVVSQMQLTRGGRDERYCPMCVLECDEGELPYGRLLWEVQCVEACHKHGVMLRTSDECGAPSTMELRSTARPSLSGVCRKCGSVGHRCVTTELDGAGKGALADAQQVARLLALPCEIGHGISADSMRRGLRLVVDTHFNGEVVRPALAAGLSRGAICSWLKGSFSPSLPGLLRLCQLAGVGLVELLQGRCEQIMEPSPRNLEKLRNYERVAISSELLAKRLSEAAQSAAPPTIAEFCRQFELGLDIPRLRCPAETQELKLASMRFREEAVKTRRARDLAAYAAAALELERSGQQVTSRTLQAQAGLIAYAGGARACLIQEVLARVEGHVR
ncbi:TniQ family protein [Mitsuaria sp. TWR114]|uniref:TniQ family protein n=1 Tax=Mitsuaria sp. TWR114 TaxID=2601731 RepID=UPI00164BBA58